MGGPARLTAKRVRIGLLLLLLVLVGIQWLRVRRAERWVPDWSGRELAAVVVLAPPDPSEEEREVLRSVEEFAFADEGRATFEALKYWFQQEYARYGERPDVSPVYLEVAGPLEVDGYPPPPPRVGVEMSFLERYRATRGFLDYFTAQRERVQVRSPTTVYVLFYPRAHAETFQGVHSVASRRDRSGFVFAPLTREGADHALINVAHELLHLYGATDKYDGERCVYPEGYYDPLQEPRLPQRYAEVMAQGIPVATGRREAELELFADMRVGVQTAYEIGWIDRARRDRYYAGDASAGPRPTGTADPDAPDNAGDR